MDLFYQFSLIYGTFFFGATTTSACNNILCNRIKYQVQVKIRTQSIIQTSSFFFFFAPIIINVNIYNNNYKTASRMSTRNNHFVTVLASSHYVREFYKKNLINFAMFYLILQLIRLH